MNLKKYTLIILFLFFAIANKEPFKGVYAADLYTDLNKESLQASVKTYSLFTKSSFIDEAAWQQISPYLLPADHPIKNQLDAIFTHVRATTSVKTFQKAGFECIALRKWDNVVVAWHRKLKGYLVKAYMDSQIGIDDQIALMKRIEGAEAIRTAIQVLGYESYFKVPKKWLYLLPDFPPAQAELQRKKFILVEEDMNLVSASKNAKLWKKEVSRGLLKALYVLLQNLGLKDSVYITNIPFSRDGKIAFVDTEHHHQWPIKFTRLTHCLNPEMQTYWLNLIVTDGLAE